MRELAVQAATDTLEAADREKLLQEVDDLTAEIQAVATRTEFNKMKILNGEGNRVSEVGTYNGAVFNVEKSIATLVYMTEAVRPGDFIYTIENAGRPAILEGVDIAAVPGNLVLFPERPVWWPSDASGNPLTNAPWPPADWQSFWPADPSVPVAPPVGGLPKLTLPLPEWNTASWPAGSTPAAIDLPNFKMPDLTYVIDNGKLGTSETIWINGLAINFSPGSSVGNVAEALAQAGISRWTDAGGKPFWVSNIAGSNQTISIQGNDYFLQFFGLKSGEAQGTDAVLSNFQFRDQLENILSQETTGLSYIADGNHVTVTGTRGEVIKFNIQSLLVPQDGTMWEPQFSFGNGKPLDNPDSWADEQSMRFEFKDYGPIKVQVGGNYNEHVAVFIPKLTPETLGLVEYKGGERFSLLNYCTIAGASQAIDKTDAAIAITSTVRARLGAYQNRLESTIRSLDVSSENTERSRSRIMDTDMAKEMTDYSQLNVMYQAGIAILGQANQHPMQILSLLN